MKWLKLFENFNKVESIVIVGGGVSSLYSAYLLKKKYPKIKYTLLEKDKECGGRIKADYIGDVDIPTGAQFSRLEKDKILAKLLKDLEIDIEPYKMKMDYKFDEIEVDKMIKKLKSKMSDFNRSQFTFSEFGKEVLGDDYEKFTKAMGYTDYESADFVDTINNYGLDDNIPGYKAANIDWNLLIERLIKFIGKENIKLNTMVKSIEKNRGTYLVNSKYECDGIIIGVTVNEIKKLLNEKIYEEIQSQNFCKIFARSKDLKDEISNYTIVDSELQKIIPIGEDVYNLAFCDNKMARKVNNKSQSEIESLLSKIFGKKINISNLKKFFWKEGTHFYKPLSKKWKNRRDFIYSAQHPKNNIWVVGEMVAEKQGWVEGALSSVEKISLFKN